jgi:hypothetical protein
MEEMPILESDILAFIDFHYQLQNIVFIAGIVTWIDCFLLFIMCKNVENDEKINCNVKSMEAWRF